MKKKQPQKFEFVIKLNSLTDKEWGYNQMASIIKYALQCSNHVPLGDFEYSVVRRVKPRK